MPKTRIRFSELRHRVTIRIPVYSDDGRGGQTEGNPRVLRRWSRIEPRTVGDSEIASQAATEATHIMHACAPLDIDTTATVVHRGRTFHVEGKPRLSDEDERFVEVELKEVV